MKYSFKFAAQLLRRNKNKMGALVMALSLATIVAPFGVTADTASDIAQKKAEKQQELERLQQQIKEYNQQIAEKRKQSASLSNEISLYNMEIRSTEIKIQATNTNIDNTSLQIDETKNQIELKKQQILENKALLAQLMIALAQYDDTSALQMGLSSSNFSEFMDNVQYTQSVQGKIFSLLQQIKAVKEKLEEDQKILEQNLEKLTNLQDELENTEESLNRQKSDRVSLLNQTKGQESRYKKLLASSQDAEAKIRKEMADLDASVSGSKTFKRLPVVKGILAWPMDGVLTQRYGNTGFTKLGYTFHNGLDLAAPAGTPIYAAGDGVVNGTGTGQEAYGNWVTIKHKAGGKLDRDIVTLYAHMTKFAVKNGQAVSKGDLIGYEGNTGNTSRLLYGPDRGYHVHFTVFDADGFGIKKGAYGNYYIPYGYTYDPMSFL